MEDVNPADEIGGAAGLRPELSNRSLDIQAASTKGMRAGPPAAYNAELLKSQNDVLELIVRGTSLNETLDFLLRAIEAQAPGMLCSILLLDKDGVHVRHGAAPSLPESFIRAIDGRPIGPRAGSCGTAAFRRETVIVDDIEHDPLWMDYRDLALQHGLRACWSTPIFDANTCVLGTFALYFRSRCRPTPRHFGLIELATHIAAIAIVKHRETEALRCSEERLRLAVTGGNVGIWEWRVGTNRLQWSPELYRMFGWPEGRNDITLRTFMKAVHPDDRPITAAALQRALARESDYSVEYRILQPDGSLHWVEAKGRAEFDAAGRPVRVMGVALDITGRKVAEQEINRREAQLAEAQRIARLGTYEWNLRNNRVYRSEELYKIFGVSAEEFDPTFEGYLNRVHAEDRDATREAIERALHERRPFDFEERIVRSDGEVRVLHSQGKWILENGAPAKLVGICQDITERKQAELDLRQSERRFQLVARATNDAIWDWDLTIDSVWWNQGVTTLFHYRGEDVCNTIAWRYEQVHADDVARVVSGIRSAMSAHEKFWSGEYRFRRADGSYADVFDRGFVVYDAAHNPIRMIGAMSDISERKRALEILEQRVAARTAELQVKNEELKGFAYTVSHDLKAPLRGIAGYAHELERQHAAGLSERATFCLKQILTATHNLDQLIEDLLHYSRLDAETPACTEVDLTRVVELILNDRRSVILEQGAEVTVSAAVAKAWTWERGLAQVLSNLIDNALKYSRMAKPSRIHISTEDDGGIIRISVADNGIGFDMKYHDRIFGLFNRLVRQEDFEGTGAGLAIARKVTEKLGGRLWAKSTPGSGAIFYVQWPALPNPGGGRLV